MARILILFIIASLSGAILFAMGEASIGESFAKLTADPWGLVTLIDLYGALFLLLIVIGKLEQNRLLFAALAIATLFLGSLVPALWLFLRLPLLHQGAIQQKNA